MRISENQYIIKNRETPGSRFFFFHVPFARSILFFSLLACAGQGCVYHGLPEPVDCTVNPVNVTIVSVQDTECGSVDGRVEVAATGGAGPYLFSLGDGPSQEQPVFTDLAAGVYEVRATDRNNCFATIAITIKNLEGLNLVFSVTESGCFETNGTITLTATDGVSPYAYRLDDGDLQSENIFDGLTHGEYMATVMDASGCEVSQVIRVKSGISFSEKIAPIIESNCAITGCHNGTQFPDFRSFSNIQNNAARIKTQTVTRTMPLEGSLTQAQINDIVCWVDDGAPDN